LNIKFIPFLNNAEGQNWRKSLESDFLSNEGKNLTDEINNIRDQKASYGSTEDYYRDLHQKKSERQELWLKNLIENTVKLFDDVIGNLSTDELDSSKTTIVAALPEFFWYDINDNNKHSKDIVFYHKPLYLDVVRNVLAGYNELTELTNKYDNLIIFAGTIMWKEINLQNHTDEKIYNTLPIYFEGELKKEWSKHNVSAIDGFYYNGNLAKAKIGKSTSAEAPVLNFNGISFTYDICLDFLCGLNGSAPLSTELCRQEKIETDVNVLIAAGMPVSYNYQSKINSPVLLRCDGLSLPYAEILEKANCSSTDISECITAMNISI